jgi:alanyl-tRNA synthetase
MPTQIEKEIDAIETRMAELAGEVKKEEELFKARLAKGKAVIEKIADTPARLQAQAFWNYLENHTIRLEQARKTLDQSAVLVQDGDTYMVVDQVTDRTRELISRAEKLGGRVVQIEKTPRQELLI